MSNPQLSLWTNINDVNEPYVQALGSFAVLKRPPLFGVSLTFRRVVSGKTQVVEKGKQYCLVVEVKCVGATLHPVTTIELYDAIVLDYKKPRTWELVSFDRSAKPIDPCPPVLNT